MFCFVYNIYIAADDSPAPISESPSAIKKECLNLWLKHS
nr:MAG TPA: hypothetical protein [Caudoviricetes sp.]